MSQAGYTPIQLYYSTTAAAVPTAGNLASGELAINIADGKLYYKNSSGVVTLLASAAAASGTSPGGSTTQVQYNNAGAFGGSANFVFDGTNVGIGASSPADKLDVRHAGVAARFTSTNGNNNQIGLSNSATAVVGFYIGSPAANVLQFSDSTGTERMRIDSSGNVGIGTSSPLARLTVSDSTATNGTMTLGNNASYNGTLQYIFSTGELRISQVGAASLGTTFYTAGSERMRIDSAGNVGIGTTPSYKLHVNGVAYADNFRVPNTAGFFYDIAGQNGIYIFGTTNGTIPNTLTVNTNGSERARFSSTGGFSVGTTADPGAGAIYATGAITAFYSDRRLKDVKGTIANALDKVASLSGVYYTNNEVAVAHGYTSAETQVGLLAQDVEAVLPEVVKAAPFDLDEKGNSKSGEHYKTIQYERVIPLLVEAIKELRAEVQALRG